MSTEIKPLRVWGKNGPNPPKVAMILTELGIPFEIQALGLDQVKSPEYLAINPNGRMPAVHDPNTDLTIWESGAIIEYLIDRYDTEHKLSFPAGTNEAYLTKQWLYFQVSGQGPYYGQFVWFQKYHPEKIPSAVERYSKEIVRVTGVLETHLAKQKVDGGDGPWLVGGKMTYADIAFTPWQTGAKKIVGDVYNEEEFPNVKKWLANMLAHDAIKQGIENLMPKQS